MAEGMGSELDAKRIVYLPRWARILTLLLSVMALLTSLGISIRLAFTAEHSEFILLSMSVAQISLGGMLFVVSLFFSARDESISLLQKRSDEFLRVQVPQALARISVPESGIARFTVESEGQNDIFGIRFHLKSGDFRFPIWIGLNVRRIFAIYFVNMDGKPPAYVDEIKRIFAFTFGGAELINFKSHYETAVVDGEHILSIWLTAPTVPDLLTNPNEKLFWAQDVAMMTESFLRTAIRNGVPLETRTKPRPL